MAYTMLLGGFDRSKMSKGPFVPFPVSSLASKAVEASDVTAGNGAVTIDSDDEKVANLGIANHMEVLGKVQYVSPDTTSGNSQDVPTYAMVEIGVDGAVIEFNYDAAHAPSIGERVVLASKASAAGKVAQSPKLAIVDSVQSAATPFGSYKSQNRVLDIDTDNGKVLVQFLGRSYGIG